jgi:cytochrome c
MNQSGLELNKIVAAVLLAGIIALVASFASDGLYQGGSGHGEKDAKRGYTIAGAESADSAGSAAPAAEEKPVDILPLLAGADLTAGEAQVKKCAACHTFDKGGKNGVGPNQWNLIGSDFGHVAGYAYSDAIKALHGSKKWGFQELSDFLAGPKKYLPGNKMSFAGIKNPQDRANLIAYLNTLSDKPLPLPK